MEQTSYSPPNQHFSSGSVGSVNKSSNPYKTIALVLAIILTLGVVGVTGYYLGTQEKSEKTAIVSEKSNTLPASPSPVSLPSPTPTTTTVKEGWITFTHPTAGFSISYPSDQLAACNFDGSNDLILWPDASYCRGDHDAFYTMDVRVVSASTWGVNYKPAKSEKITLNGSQATKNTYVFTENDGVFYGWGSVTEVLIPLPATDKLVAASLVGNAPENMKLFDNVIATFRLE